MTDDQTTGSCAGCTALTARLADLERRFHALMAELTRLDRLAQLAPLGKCSALVEGPLGPASCGNPSYELHRSRPLCVFHIYDAREANGESVYG